MIFRYKIENSFVPGCPFIIICDINTYNILHRKVHLITKTILNQYSIIDYAKKSVWM
jgi:hypothetical protein